MAGKPQELNLLYVTNRDDWRKWLERNHAKEKDVWLVYYKKHTGTPRLPYDHAVEEALCFGWIDTTVKRLDDDRFAQRFTPRTNTGNWSELNRQRLQKMIAAGKMTEAGLAKVAYGDTPAPSRQATPVPVELESALSGNKAARAIFEKLAPSYRRQFIAWVADAKRPETRERRSAEAARLLAEGKKLFDSNLSRVRVD
jgi:uncharacterized protein YdeI (YjbR/CyaY-like superfamily)